MKLKVHCAYVEVTPMPGCVVDPTEVAGATVRCYVRAAGSADAETRCIKALREDNFEIVDVHWCVADDEVEWEYPDDDEGIAHVGEAANSDSVIYGEFHSWVHGTGDD